MKKSEALKKTTISLFGTIALIYSMVAAGCFGIEESIPAGGPGVTIMLLAVLPFIWAYPLSSIISELGSLMPTEGGVYAWAHHSLGEFWGWCTGIWSALNIILSQASFCTLAVGYLQYAVELSGEVAYLLKLLLILIFTIVNIIGIKSLEKLETVFTVIVLFAFLAVTVVGFMNWSYNPIEPFYNSDESIIYSIGDSLSIVIWMYCGYEGISNLAGELNNPQIIPKGMKISQPLIGLAYILPTVAALAAIGSWDSWSVVGEEGAVGYSDVLTTYIGPWAGILFIIVAIISNSSIFCSYVASGSRAIFVLSEDHMFPKSISKVSKRGCPAVAIITTSVITAIACIFDFTTLVMLTIPMQLLLYAVVSVVLIKTRKEYPIAKRKNTNMTFISGGNVMYKVFAFLVLSITVVAFIFNGSEYFTLGILALIGTAVLYIICKLIYKGRNIEDPAKYPLSKRTKLGIGDIHNISIYTMLTGAFSVFGSFVLNIYEGDFGLEYYLEEYGSGLFSNFYGMLTFLFVVGLILLAIGFVMYLITKKTEGDQFKQVAAAQKKDMDDKLMEIHGRPI